MLVDKLHFTIVSLSVSQLLIVIDTIDTYVDVHLEPKTHDHVRPSPLQWAFGIGF